jgi:hypothetical protein
MRPQRRRDAQLNSNQVFKLIAGFYFFPWQEGFANEDEERRAWQEHRAEITALARSRGRAMPAASRFDFEPPKPGLTTTVS